MRMFFLIYLFAFLFSCTKKHEELPEELPINYVLPMEYFPIYPGSWWNYLDQNGNISAVNTDTSWALCNYNGAWGYFPKWQNRPVLGYRYLYVTGMTDSDIILRPYLAQNFSKSYYNHVGIQSSIWVRSNSVYETHSCQAGTFSNVVWVAQKTIIYQSLNPGQVEYSIDYYAPNVGLIKSYSSADSINWIQTKDLVNWHINN